MIAQSFKIARIKVFVWIVVCLLLSSCQRSIDKTKQVKDYITQAIAYSQNSDFKKAIEELKKAIEIKPDDGELYFGLGVCYIYQGLDNEALEAFNKGLNFISFEPSSKINLPVIERMSPYIYEHHKVDIMKEWKVLNGFRPQDIVYIRQCITLKTISDRLTRNITGTKNKIFSLFEYTYRNLSLDANRFPPDHSLSILPLDVLLRGYGLCDQSAWVFNTLVRQSGYFACMFQLYDTQTSTNPHTLSIVFIDNKWLLFDTLFGVTFYNQDGSIASLDEVTDRSEITFAIPAYKDRLHRCFQKGYIVIDFQVESLFPRMYLVQKALNKFITSPPKVFFNTFEYLCLLLTSFDSLPEDTKKISLPFKLTKREYTINVWHYPFSLKLFYETGDFAKYTEQVTPTLKYILKAREMYLLGNYKDALNEYEKIQRELNTKMLEEDILYFKALCYFENKEYKEALNTLEMYIEKYPEGRWKNGATHHIQLSRLFQKKTN